MGCITITTKEEGLPPAPPPPSPEKAEKAIPWESVFLLLAGLAVAYLALRR
jgi:hypothetical protein